MIEVKVGVDLSGLSKEIWQAVLKCEPIFAQVSMPLVITSGRDGRHMPGSKHYTGNAVDFRSLHLRNQDKPRVLSAIKAALGKDYDVLLHGTVEHFHVEYDPK